MADKRNQGRVRRTTGLLRIATVAALAAAGVALQAAVPSGGYWSGWRGDGSGISLEPALPTVWDATNHVVWRTPLPGEGSSSPVIWGQRVFVTASADNGQKRLVLCLDARSGVLLWQKELTAERVPKTDPKSGYAPATPVTDGQRLYVFFDSPGLIAFDLDGRQRWLLPLGPFDSPYNVASSPVLCGDQVILCCDHAGDSFVLAADKANGRLRWRTPRKLGLQYSTPLVIAVRGKSQVVVGATTVKAYDPDSGAELWSCGGLTPTVAPSPVFGGGLVYATSGRNGPTLAIDPGGFGDVKDTRVRMQAMIGGPYVPSPLLCPLLLVPGDDGQIRFLDQHGTVAVQQRLRAHFTASPLLGGSNVYWTAESGDTYVLDVSGVTGDPPAVRIAAVNPLGETCLASPAAMPGRLLIRTTNALYCIGGVGGEAAVATAEAPAVPFDDLRHRYEEHAAAEGPDIPVRLAVVDGMAGLADTQAVGFLKTAALKDPHWDVSEAAAKALASRDGPGTAAALLDLGADWRPYLRVIAAQGLARLRAREAIPWLLNVAKEGDALVRAAALEALGDIGAADPPNAADVLPGVTRGLADADGAVRVAAAGAVARMPEALGEARATIVENLMNNAAQANPLVSAAARRALGALHIAEDTIMEELNTRVLYGGARERPVREQFTVGPIRFTFQDGELRYLYVGDTEIIRRVYFAVRDKGFDTVMPRFTRMNVVRQANAFTIHMEAVCKGPTADYRWSGVIVGSPEGGLEFRVSGEAGSPFSSPRIGLNVLFGAEALAGLPLVGTDTNGSERMGAFPADVATKLVTDVNLQSVRYVTRAGMQVTCTTDSGIFGIEDQRNFCDSSYKAFHNLGYAQAVPTGEVRRAKLTIAIDNEPSTPALGGPVHITLGKDMNDARMPRILPAAQSQKGVSFAELNGKRDAFRAATNIAWAFNPSAHLPDEDMFMENVSAVIDQVRTVRAFAPGVKTIRIDPIGFDSPHPRPGRDPRNGGLFGAAWCGAMAGSLAAAGADEAVFTVGPGPAAEVQGALARYGGAALFGVTVTGPSPAPVAAFGVRDGQARVLWLVNKTDLPQDVVVDKLPKRTVISLSRLNAETIAQPEEAESSMAAADRGALDLHLRLLPYEVCRVHLGTSR